MDDDRLSVASIISVPFLEKEAPGSWNRRYELLFDNECDRQLILLFLEFNLIFKRFVVIVCSCLAENCVSILLVNGVKLEFEADAL